MNAVVKFQDFRNSDRSVADATHRQNFKLVLDGVTDEELMEMVVKENIEAYEVLMHRHFSRVTKLAARIVYVGGDTDDAVQEVFLNMWKHKDTWLNWRSAFTTWLYRITVHKCIDINKKARYSDLDDVQEPVSHELDAVSHLHVLQFNKQLTQAIANLSEGQKQAVLLHYNDGMTAQECADTLGLKKTAVEALLKRARQKLREVLLSADLLEDHVDAPNQIQFVS